MQRIRVWSGWLLLMELEAQGPGQPDEIVRKYTWGLDLAGQMGGTGVSPVSLEQAGGIGGLLAMQDACSGEDYVVLYDANGNVGQLVAWAADYQGAAGNGWHADRLVARYEYDPYGNVIGPDTDADGDFDEFDQPGAYAADNPFRFSTKYYDGETDLYYFGYRYYSPGLGRWLNRDPIGESGFRVVGTQPGAVTRIPRDSLRNEDNLYRFVRNRPSNACDLLGLYHISEPTTRECCNCGPDVTDWLVQQLNQNLHSAKLKEIRHLWNYESESIFEPWFSETIAMIEALMRWRELVKAGAEWDFKVSQSFATANCPSPECANTVTLCGVCFYYDVPGNIHYGFIGLSTGFSNKTLLAAAAHAQRGGVDEPGDKAAINIGFEYYDARIAWKGWPPPEHARVNGAGLCSLVRRDKGKLNSYNHTSALKDCPGKPCTKEQYRGAGK